MGDEDTNRYQLGQELLVDTFVSITLAWDREVEFSVNIGAQNAFDADDEFEDYTDPPSAPQATSVINNLSLSIVNDNNQVVAESIANEGTVQHLFFQIPETGNYDFLVKQEDDDVGNNQDYAVAWWAISELAESSNGDFDDDGDIDGADLGQWKDDFRNIAMSDADQDGDSDGNDFLIWQRNLGTSAAPVTAPVPEPGTSILVCLALPLLTLGET